MNAHFIEYLQNFVVDKRVALLKEKLGLRTQYITVVLENVFQSQNASAILRTCDCFGVQDVYVIETSNKFVPNDQITMGADRWLTVNTFNRSDNNTLHAIHELKNKGYRIVATSFGEPSVPLHAFDLNKGKAAIVFGTERTGISQTVKDNADEFLVIPMAGFTESLNVSVALGIIVQSFMHQLRLSAIDWQMDNDAAQAVMIRWLQNSVRNFKLLEKHYHENVKNTFQNS